MKTGIYESLITEALREKLNKVDQEKFFIVDRKYLDIEEAIHFLSLHDKKAFRNALKVIKVEKKSVVSKQIEITSKLIQFLDQHIEDYEFSEDLIEAQGKILQGI